MKNFYVEYAVLGKTYYEYMTATSSTELVRKLHVIHRGHRITVIKLRLLLS